MALVICAGTDGALRWSAANPGLPTLYFGAHPDNHGLEIISRPEVSGVRLNLPLIWSRDTFSLIGDLLPDLRDIFIVLNLQSEFAFPGVRANYGLSRRLHGPGWITAPSTHLGYRAVSFLASGIGCRYHEGPFADLGELDALLRQIPAGALVGARRVQRPGAGRRRARRAALQRARAAPAAVLDQQRADRAGGRGRRLLERLRARRRAARRDGAAHPARRCAGERGAVCRRPGRAPHAERATLRGARPDRARRRPGPIPPRAGASRGAAWMVRRPSCSRGPSEDHARAPQPRPDPAT